MSTPEQIAAERAAELQDTVDANEGIGTGPHLSGDPTGSLKKLNDVMNGVVPTQQSVVEEPVDNRTEEQRLDDLQKGLPRKVRES